MKQYIKRAAAFYLLVGSIFWSSISLQAQDLSPELFQQHMKMLARHPLITRTFSMIDQQNNYHFYLDVICFAEFYSREPIKDETHQIFFWKTGEITFYQVEQYATLVNILEPSDDRIIYEFISRVDRKRYVLQVLFTESENEGWKLIGVRKTRIKPAKKPLIGNLVI